MSKVKRFLYDYGPTLMQGTGLALLGGGELWAYFDKRKRNTVSEEFVDAPEPLRYVIIGSLFGLIVHLIRWTVSLKSDGDVTIIGDNATVNTSAETMTEKHA